MKIIKSTFLCMLFFLSCTINTYAASVDSDTLISSAEESKNDKPQPQPENSVDTVPKAISWFPIMFYTQENNFALGIGTMRAFQWEGQQGQGESAHERMSSITAMAFYTLNKQFLVEAAPDFYFDHDQYNVKLRVNYSKMPSVFFGTGEEFSKDEEGEDYDTENTFIQADMIKKLRYDFRLGLRYEWHDYAITEKKSGGLLDSNLFLGDNGGVISGIGFIVDRDSRNNTFWSERGGYHQFIAMKYIDNLGSDFEFEQYTVDLRQFVPIRKRSVLAVQGVVQVSQGNVPFNRLAQLGGPLIMRGIYQGRYRDNNLIALQGEYRHEFNSRWYFTIFAGVGDVGHTMSDFAFNDLKYTAGSGFRFALDPKNHLNLRMDVGISEFGVTPTIMLGEAF